MSTAWLILRVILEIKLPKTVHDRPYQDGFNVVSWTWKRSIDGAEVLNQLEQTPRVPAEVQSHVGPHQMHGLRSCRAIDRSKRTKKVRLRCAVLAVVDPPARAISDTLIHHGKCQNLVPELVWQPDVVGYGMHF